MPSASRLAAITISRATWKTSIRVASSAIPDKIPAMRWMGLLLVLLASAPAAADPWAVGDEIHDWVVEEVVNHPEYVRLVFSQGSETTSVEITRNQEGPGPWATESARIQAAPGHSPPVPLLRAVLEATLAIEEAGVAPLPDPFPPPPQRPPWPWGRSFLVLAGLVAAAASVRTLRARRRQRHGGAVAAGLVDTARWGLRSFLLATPGFVLLLFLLDSLLWVGGLRALRPEILVGFSEMHRMDLRTRSPWGFRIWVTDGRLSWTDDDGAGGEVAVEGVEHLVLAFGGSSLVVTSDPDGRETFCGALEERLDAAAEGTWRVANLGVSGFDSTTVRERVLTSLETLSPDLILIYTGHNDNKIYQHFRERVLGFNVRRPYLTDLASLAWWLTQRLRDAPDPSFELPVSLEPWLLTRLHSLGVIDLGILPFDLLRDVIVESYERNLRQILEAAGRRGVPVLLVTTVGPFSEAYPPFGIDVDEEAWARSLADPDPVRRVAALRAIKDQDTVGWFVTSKSEQNAVLRSLEGPGVHVFDLEKWLVDRGHLFDLGPDGFGDECHFNGPLHIAIGRALGDFVMERRLSRGHSNLEEPDPYTSHLKHP